MHGVPEQPSPQTRTAVTTRIKAHVQRGWPHLGEPDVTHRGQFCYVAARLPGHRQPATPADPATALPRINRPLDHRDLPRQRRALHRGRTAHVLRPQDRNPRTGHRSHLHPLRRPRPPALTPSRPARNCESQEVFYHQQHTTTRRGAARQCRVVCVRCWQSLSDGRVDLTESRGVGSRTAGPAGRPVGTASRPSSDLLSSASGMRCGPTYTAFAARMRIWSTNSLTPSNSDAA